MTTDYPLITSLTAKLVKQIIIIGKGKSPPSPYLHSLFTKSREKIHTFNWLFLRSRSFNEVLYVSIAPIGGPSVDDNSLSPKYNSSNIWLYFIAVAE